MEPAIPGSLSEGAAERSEAEGVSSDGSSMPMIYTPAHINSEIFDRLRSSKYTPSVSLSLDSSLREGAGVGCVPFNVPPGNRKGAGDFHRPYATQKILDYTIHRTTLPQSALRAASSLREGAGKCSHSTGYSLMSGVTGDFHRPYGGSEIFTFYHSMEGGFFDWDYSLKC